MNDDAPGQGRGIERAELGDATPGRRREGQGEGEQSGPASETSSGADGSLRDEPAKPGNVTLLVTSNPFFLSESATANSFLTKFFPSFAGGFRGDHGQPRGSRSRVLAGRNNEFLCQGNHFVSNHFMLQITFVICSQWVSLCWFVLCCVVFLSPSGRLSLLCAGVVSAALALEIVVRDGQRWLSYAEKRFVDRW